MDEETEAPLESAESAQDDADDDTYVGRSSGGGSTAT